MTKKNYISILTFLIIFTIGLNYFNKVFTSFDTYINTNENFKSLARQKNIDLLFIGSSYTYCTYNPLIFNNHSKND